MASKAFGMLRNAVVGVFVATILAGILEPVYSDEIGWRLQERAGFDGVDKLLSELCGPNTIARPPFWMMPVRYYSAFFNGAFADPIYVRISGILYALAWMVLVLLLIRRIADSAPTRIALSILALGFMNLGTMPLLLIWSRPEQPILLAFTGAIFIACADRRQPNAETAAAVAWRRSLVILALAMVALSYHLKAIFVVPLFLTCLLFASRGRKAHLPRLVAGAALVVAWVWAAQYWIHRLQCPNDPVVQADFARNNIGALLVNVTHWSQLVPIIGKAFHNISVFQYLGMPAPREVPMSSWLPPHKVTHTESFRWFLVLVFAWAVALLFAAERLVAAARRMWRERRLDGRIAMALALVATVLAWSATQGFRNIYEATFVVPMMVLAVVLVLSTYEGSERFAAGFRALAAGVGVLALVSPVLIAIIYGPSFVRAAGEPGYVSGQPYSMSAFGYGKLKHDILGAARKCGIDDPDRAHGLMLDDVTYFAFMKSHMPEHRQGILNKMIELKDPIGYLRSIKSDGAVLSCQGLPPKLRARAKSQGKICCLAPPGW